VNREEIERLIPHRAPFLWIDEITSADQQCVRARKFLDPQLDVFAGHYPRFPVLPGVLVCEACFQAGALLIALFHAAKDDGKVPVVARLNNVKFRRMVRPGETLDIEARLTDRAAKAFFLDGKVTVEEEVACTLEFACTLAAVGAPDQNSG
jgi:3-hydroxyacyl-[acyl-carrier-protein] dehydratase